MTIREGERLPDAALIRDGDDGFETIRLADFLAGRTVVLFGLPGAYTGTCSTSHLPSFMRTAEDYRAAGVDEIACIAVNDPFVMKAWGEATGATEAGITMLADPSSDLTKALGMEFSVPELGFIDRSNRYAMVADDGVVRVVNIDAPNTCDISTGESLLERLKG